MDMSMYLAAKQAHVAQRNRYPATPPLLHPSIAASGCDVRLPTPIHHWCRVSGLLPGAHDFLPFCA